MALPILDGNQTSVTLATTVSGGAHYPNHIIASAVTISSLPAISGTVTIGAGTAQIGSVTASISGIVPVSGTFYQATQPVSIASLPALATGTNQIGSVTASISGTPTITGSVSVLNFPATQTVTFTQIATHGVTIAAGTAQIGSVTASISGTVPISISSVTVGNSVTIGSLPAISGTVTANLGRPTWTNYSGTVATANTAVTAISTSTRSYLLAQVTTGQMFLNIGATATTLNSVYFAAGQGFAWETSVPQGFVSIISAVTGTKYVLKEG